MMKSLVFLFVQLLSSCVGLIKLKSYVESHSQLRASITNNKYERVGLQGKIEAEIEAHKSSILPSFNRHRKRIEALAGNQSFQPADGLACLHNSQVFHYASQFDEIDQTKHNNINDKIWRTAIKYGSIFFTIDDKLLQPDRVGPFTEASCQYDNLIFANLIFSKFCIIRYVFKEDTRQTVKLNQINPSAFEVQYLEFQWLLFGKLVYNRIINRRELWKKMYQTSDEMEVVFDIRNKNEDEEPYERLLVFKQCQ